ncbi:DNA phosphorothioation-dependent restriction protein DptH [Lysinibacillus fusiformis]|uniref:DNA phosphorothioation-dependent restriction protein DptH n=1 Tax=Lysinibacillus fusiformis TaxID=28031 RepID=UPI001E38CA22|nr:DNA phosphorothioation-dependent restriction protein DptH [Lysinibacillus fusiformis]
MSNQFYNYLAEELIKYWGNKDHNLKKGNRYFFQLDSKDEVLEMALALKSTNLVEVIDFEYSHEFGDTYKTFALVFDDVKLVVAYTRDGVLTDYLATIRNLVSEQLQKWGNTALISIVSEQLDTIPGGSLDVQSEGMPLHVSSLAEKLHDQISNSQLSKAEKIILNDYLEQIVSGSSIFKLSIFELEEILAILYKGKIEQYDYKDLGLFCDSSLEEYTGSSLKNRIAENRRLFELVREANEFNNTEEHLQKHFTSDGARMLQKENWEEIAFSDVNKDHLNYLRENKTSKVNYVEIKSTDQLVVWDRPLGDSSAQKRKRQILVFNPEFIDEINLVAKFNLEGKVKSLKKDFISQGKGVSEINVDVKTTNIHLNISASKDKPIFSQVTYKHEKNPALGAEFYICVLPVSFEFFNKISSQFTIDAKKEKIVVSLSGNTIQFGNSDFSELLELNNLNETFEVDFAGSYIISIEPSLFEDDQDVTLSLNIDGKSISFLIDSEITDATPINGSRIWKLVRETMTDMRWNKEGNRLIHQHREYYIKSSYAHYFEWEHKWLDKAYRSGKLNSGILESVTIELSEELREAYSRFLACFKTATQIPSLTHVSKEYYERGLEYIRAFAQEVASFEEGRPAGKRGVHLFKLGVIETDDTVYITPFHPLMVAYKLKVYEVLSNEDIDNLILSRLSPEALLPFIEHSGELYRPQNQDEASEWLVLKSVNKVTASDSVQYLSNVITDKLNQFKEHFSYLFTSVSNAPILINVMNLPDDLEVLKGIINFMKKELSSKGTLIKPIEVTLYTDEQVTSAFEKFSNLKTPEQVEEFLDIKFKESKKLDTEDVLRIICENLFFYNSSSLKNNGRVRYAHITFYKMHAQEHSAIQSMHEMKSDLALQGLYASVPAMRDTETYKTGFGIKGYSFDHEKEYLVETAYRYNELAGNSRNKGNDSYLRGNTVLSRVDTEDEAILSDIFESSHWVTFIDPTVDLSFFKEFNNNLVVIHYSDQYTSSNKYDAITVTNKSDQYYKVIKEFLTNKDIVGSKENILNTIQAFNTFNGEWLLRIIGSKGYIDREKLSIVSAIKYSLAILDHPNIKWVPISLEEILRVGGVFNLSKTGGIFSAKNLGITGSTSDDLLLIGVEDHNGEITLHFYPIEVKFGINNSEVIKKAKEQVNKTKQLLMNALVLDYPNTFKEKFYRNFFVQLLLSNLNKIVQNDIWSSKEYELGDEVIEKLTKLDFKITDHLTSLIGKGAIFSFKEGSSARTAYVDGDIHMIEFSKEDGFNGIVRSMDDTNYWIHNSNNELIKKRFLKNVYDPNNKSELSSIEAPETNYIDFHSIIESENNQVGSEVLENSDKDEITIPIINSKNNQGDYEGLGTEEKDEITPIIEYSITDYVSTEDDYSELGPIESTPIEEDEESLIQLAQDREFIQKKNPFEKVQVAADNTDIEYNTKAQDEDGSEQKTDSQIGVATVATVATEEVKSLSDVRILLGTVEHSEKEIFWEYGHNELANRHLLISGKSGQGKTYFMQCLLLEKSKQGISSLIVDYTEGFLPNQLEDEFIEALGDRFKQRVVYTEKLPINPFTRNTRFIGSIEIPESNIDIAERVKSVFAAVYPTLGIQQLSMIYDRILVGLERYEEHMSLNHLKDLLEEEGSSTALKALSQLRPLIDRNPFTNSSSINWRDHIESKGDVFVIQLTGFPRDVQLIITEFLLWDLWNYTIREGNKNIPMPVILDEAQNLDHKDESPSARILTEGRKFGWSAWFATQFLKAQMGSDELARLQNATQKIYFAQSDEDVSYIANTLVNEDGDKKYWENKLLNLRKGQCIVQGPQLDAKGNLSKPRNIVVNITPLTKRI